METKTKTNVTIVVITSAVISAVLAITAQLGYIDIDVANSTDVEQKALANCLVQNDVAIQSCFSEVVKTGQASAEAVQSFRDRTGI